MPKTKVSFLVIDDHPMLREGLKFILQRDERFDVLAEASTGKEGIEKTKEYKPDMILLDISLPDANGIKLIPKLKAVHPDVQIIMVSMHSRHEHITEALKTGAVGYVVKESASENLITGIDNVINGGYCLDSSVMPLVVEGLKAPQEKPSDKAEEFKSLTPREQEVMRLIAEGHPSRIIAEKLFISPKTAENHRANLMRKLNLNSNIDLIRYAAKAGLIDLEMWLDADDEL